MATRFFRHGWHSWSPAAWHDPALRWPSVTHPELIINADDPVAATDPRSGSGLGALERDGEITLLGGLDLDSRVRLVDDALVPSGGNAWATTSGSRDEAFAQFLSAFTARWGSRVSGSGPVWCSWYSYWNDIDEDLLTKTLDDVAQFPFAVFQIDAGWEQTLGDWQPNQGFASGMAVPAERIKEKGMRPGLWLAPFAAHRRSALAARYPQFLLLDESGAPVRFSHNWGEDGLALDVTRPDVLEWMGEMIATVVGWGFDYLKLDFIYAGAFPGRRHASIEREAGYRQAIEALRAAAGDEVFLLACGAPVVASIGVFDAIRAGPDTAPFWEDTARIRWLEDWSGGGARNALATVCNRLWLGDAITVDPDVAFFRTRYNLLTPTQRRLGQDLALITGFRSTSDPPAWLDSEEKVALEEFLTTSPKVTQLSPVSFTINDRSVDFGSVMLEETG